MNLFKSLNQQTMASWCCGPFVVVFISLCLGNASLQAQFDPQHIRVVDTNASGNNDGTSWVNAYNFLQDALVYASIPQNGITEIWVAKGIHVPDRDADNPSGTDNLNATFLLNFNNISVLGGFIGTEDDPLYRNPDLNVTVLSGLFDAYAENICGDKEAGKCSEVHQTPGCNDADCCTMICTVFPSCCQFDWDASCVSYASIVCGLCGEPGAGNCFIANGTPGCDDAECCATVCDIDQFCCDTYWDGICADLAINFCPTKIGPRARHVVTANEVDDSVRIDGFTITRGLADGIVSPNGVGAGMLILNASPAVVSVTFIKNSASGHGGGAMHIEGASNPMVVNTIFTQNSGFEAGAIHTEAWSGTATFVNCLFSKNSSQVQGGAINPGGSGIHMFINCTFSDNSVENQGGGAILREGGQVNLTSCILWGNLAAGKPSQIAGSVNVTYSDVQGGWGVPEDMNIDEDPLFINADIRNYRLQLGSPCFDMGNPDEKMIPLDIFDVDHDMNEKERTPDLDLLDRIVNGHVDMGVYEIPCPWDLDSSGSVDTSDLLALFAQWGTTGSADFNGDGIVNTSDLLILFANWGLCG